jgi:hypothetical protein
VKGEGGEKKAKLKNLKYYEKDLKMDTDVFLAFVKRLLRG